METQQIPNYLVTVYLIYAAVSISLTIWLARTLFKNGEVFFEDVFAANPRLGTAVNRLLVIGFYLLNLGYAMTILKVEDMPTSPMAAIEALAGKLGVLLISLGAMHFVNMALFHKMQRRGQIRMAPPPVAPQLRHDQTVQEARA